jgi:glycosyltransferase involved in cell wall biosynthesis
MKKDTFKTLVYSDLYPLPENIGTRMRTMNFVRYFKRLGEVDLVYHRTGSEKNAVQGPFRKEFRIEKRGVSEEYGNISRYRDFTQRIRRLAEQRPWIVADWPKKAIEALHAVVAGDDYDIILCRYMHDSSPFLGFHGTLRKKVIIDMDDVFSTSLFDSYVKRGPGMYAGMKWRLQRKMLLDFQERCLTVGATLFCSDDDRKEVTRRAASSNTHLVPNTYPATARIREPDGSGHVNRRTLLFIGALDYRPNITGLRWFVDSIFPRVKEQYRDIRLLVVGRNPPENLLRFCSEYPGVELYHDVPDVAPYYEMCGAVVVPLLSGGGTRIKILEAAMAARPVLSTPLGVHGLDCPDGPHKLLFTDSDGFLERYGYLENEVNYRDCVIKMHAAVQNTYSPEAFDRSMEQVVGSLLGEPIDRVAPRASDG